MCCDRHRVNRRGTMDVLFVAATVCEHFSSYSSRVFSVADVRLALRFFRYVIRRICYANTCTSFSVRRISDFAPRKRQQISSFDPYSVRRGCYRCCAARPLGRCIAHCPLFVRLSLRPIRACKNHDRKIAACSNLVT